ncbi:helix-turn-helix transcriptional regulator [Shewanella frigidimarina]|uniref:helix-turn-helix transcriptional regulator n=1 Tax=Shewanella frigidimarina TaxID=56812 RepID=UPI003D7AD794
MANGNTIDLLLQIKDSNPKGLIDVVVNLFPELTKREAETLYWLSTGVHVTEAAKVMSISDETANSHIKKCKFKLNMKSNTDLRLIYNSRLMHLQLACLLNISALVLKH